VEVAERERPAEEHPATGAALEHVPNERLAARGPGLEAVGASEVLREAEDDALAGHVLGDLVANGAVAAPGAHGQAAVEPHRRPALGGPEPVVLTGQPVDEVTHPRGGAGDESLVHVAHLASPESRSRTLF
jgi:hypothetical protein